MDSPSVRIDPGTIHQPIPLNATFPVDLDLVLTCQRVGDKPYRGTPIGKIPELWPREGLKRTILGYAKTFIRHMKAQGYEAQQAETELELWGPYREKMDMGKGGALVNFQEGNPLVPQGHWGTAAHGLWEHDGITGPRQLDPKVAKGHQDWQRGVVFLIRGKFLATHGHREETTGSTIV